MPLLCALSAAWEPMTEGSCRQHNRQTKWIVADDCDVSAQAKATAEKECASSAGEEVDRERGRKILEDGAGKNIFRENLEKAKNSDEFGEGVGEDYQNEAQGIVMDKGGPAIVAIVVVAIWFCCCWTLCPSGCCQKCRCRAKEHKEAPKLHKMIVFVIWFGLILGCLVAAILANTGKANIDKGLDRFVCASSELASFSLSGKKQDGDNFMGMLPILLYINDVVGNLRPGGKFNTEVQSLMDLTVSIEKAVNHLAGTLELFTNTAGQSENVNPKDAGGGTLEHKCVYCEQVKEKIGPVVADMKDSLAEALKDAREQVKDQLSGEKATNLANDLEDQLDPVRKQADLVRDQIGKVTEPDFGDTKEMIKGIIGQIVTLITALVFPLMFCGCIAVSCFAVKETTPTPGQNPYNKMVPRCACCGCCFGTLYVVIVMIVAGLLHTVVQPIASICLIAADLNGDNLEKWGPALGVDDPEQESAQRMFDIVDTCFTEAGTGDIFSVLKVKSCPRGEDGTRPSSCDESVKEELTVREALVDEIQFNINKAFDKVNEKDQEAPKTTEQDGFKQLIDFLSIPLGCMTFFSDPVGMPQRPQFAGFATGVKAAEIGRAGFSTHGSCEACDITKQLDQINSDSVRQLVNEARSINRFRKEVEDAGLGSGSSSATQCVSPMACLTSSNPAACESVNEILKLKKALQESPTYRCDMLYAPCSQTGFQQDRVFALLDQDVCYCDPKEMSKTGGVTGNEWTGECLVEEGGTFVTKSAEKQCGFDELQQYVADYKVRLEKTAGALDDSVGGTKDKIVTNLKSIVNEHVFETILELIDGINCKYLGPGFNKIVDGLCFQATRGVSEIAHAYTALGSLGIIVVIYLYFLWRWSVDNVNHWKPDAPEQPQGAQA